MVEIKPKTRKEIYLAYLSGDMSLELPEPLTRDEVNLYNLCKNKAYGEYTTVKEVLAEQELVFAEQNGLYAAQLNYEDLDAFSVGARIKVLFDGVEYALTVESQSEVIYGGNAGLTGIGVDTGEPFVIGLVVPTQSAMVITSSAEPAHTVAIYEEVTEVKKISGKYVEGMGYVEKNTTMLLEKQELAFATDAGNGVYKSDITLTCDMEYVYANSIPAVVVFDGVEHKLPFQSGSAFGFGNATLAMKAVGVPEEQWAAMGVVDTGEDFMVVYNGAKNYLEIYCSDNENHTVEVYLLEETIHPIDQKFIVLTSPNGTQYNLSVADDGTLSAVAAT